jgi:hypothetical protein
LPEVLKPPLSRGNSISPMSTAPTSAAPIGPAPAGVIASGIINNGINRTDVSIDPYELNKLNTGKPGFTKNREMIIGYKFKYFRKGNKKG